MDTDMLAKDDAEANVEMEDFAVTEEDDLDNVVLEDSSDDNVQVLDEARAVFLTPGRKKKNLKVREELDDSFLRRSRRLSKKAEGYKDAKSAKEAKSTMKSAKMVSKKKAKKTTQTDEEPIPLAVFPPQGSVVAPHLPQEVLQGIGEGFLQIQPEVVSATLLKQDNIDD